MDNIAREYKPNKQRSHHLLSKLLGKEALGISVSIVVFALVLWGLPASFDGAPAKMLAIVAMAIVLWVTEAIPIGLTAVLLLVLMLLLHPVSLEVVYSGFASSAVFLIIGGMMLASAVNETQLVKRFSYFILSKWGGNAKGLLASILVIPQIQSFFIPATAVRTTLLLPIALNVLDTIGASKGSRLRKMILLGVAFGGTVSGTAVMTAAIGNILMVGLVDQLLGIKITYFQWFLYAFPIWLLLIPCIWFVLTKCFPLDEKEQNFPHIKDGMKNKMKDFGPLTGEEIRCLIILTITVGLWMTEPLHGLNPSIPALIGVVLMTLPGIGCTTWEKIVNINFNTVFLLGATLSMGYALNKSGAAEKIGEVFGMPWIISVLHHPILAVIFILVITQLVHLIMSNVSTAVVTLIPIYISLATLAHINPIFICFTAAITCLHGYILVVETMTNIVVYSSGQLTQREFLKPGVFATIAMMAITLVVAVTWWNWLGLL